VVPLALARAAYGVGTVFAPRGFLPLLGFHERELTPATRLWAGLFGVRELVLPAMLVSRRRDAGALRLALGMAAAADLGDALVASRALVLGEGRSRAAAGLLASALAGTAVAALAFRAVGQANAAEL